MPSLIKPHFPPSTMRCHFSPERVLPPPVFAMKMSFPPEGPLVSAVALGVNVAKPECTTRHPSRDKLKQVCSTLLHWEVDKFEEVEAFIFDLVDDCLDHSTTPARQQSEKIHMVYDKATLRFPCLNNIGQPYDIWLIKDLIALRLKHWRTKSAGKATAKATSKKRGTTRVGELTQ